MLPKLCSIPECERPHKARGFCNTHYYHLLKGHVDMRPITPPGRTVDERFWEKVRKSPTCWNWTAAISEDDGYGRFGIGQSVKLAHRVSFELSGGVIPAEMEIDHKCHNRACVNPAHLRVVTSQKNRENHSGPQSNSKTGIRGVYWVKAKGKWGASVNQKGHKYFVGYFTDIQAAADAVLNRRNELFTHNNFDRRAAS
jgi:hypothetical protein